MTKLIYLQGYPESLLAQVTTLIEQGRLGEVLQKRYPQGHDVNSISKGMLVEMEKEAANPSIAILCKLAAALGVSVADIVNVASEPALHIIPAEQIPTLWQGPLGGSARLLAGTAGPNMIELWRWEMQPGEAFASPGHPATTFELLHVEAGALTLTLGATCRTVAAGESAVARTEIEHGYRNEGTAPLVFTMTVAELPS